MMMVISFFPKSIFKCRIVSQK